MKLLAVLILHKENDTEVKILQNEFNLDSFNYFKREHVKSFLIFSARTAVQRTDRNIKQSVDLGEDIKAIIHVYVRADGLSAAVISDHDYPKRVAHNLLNKVMDNFTTMYPSTSWNSITEGSGKMTSLSEMLTKYQNPQEADALMSLQKDVDETKEIMIKTLENVLRRGENLDVLIERSSDLSFETKILYKESKKLNRCCILF